MEPGYCFDASFANEIQSSGELRSSRNQLLRSGHGI